VALAQGQNLDKERGTMTKPTTHVLVAEAWKTALDEIADLGTTDRFYGNTRPESELWDRAIRLYRERCFSYPDVDGARDVPRKLTAEQAAGEYAIPLAMVRQAYAERLGSRLISLNRIVELLHAKGHLKAYVEHTGGGTATLVSGTTWRDDSGDDRHDARFGPGEFYGIEFFWQEPYARPSELFVGRDDDGTTMDNKLPDGATDEQIAEAIHLQILASQAMANVGAFTQQVRDSVLQRMPWGMRVTDDQCELLSEQQPFVSGGDADWRVAVFLYELDEVIATEDLLLSAGSYIRTVEGKHEQAFSVPDRQAARQYVLALEDEYLRDSRSGR
jgi:hypothetical protein